MKLFQPDFRSLVCCSADGARQEGNASKDKETAEANTVPLEFWTLSLQYTKSQVV